MIVNLAGRRIRIEQLPPPVRPALRWDGSDQAYPVAPMAAFGRSLRVLGAAMSDQVDRRPPRRVRSTRERHAAR